MIGSFKFPPPESKLCSNVLPKCRIWWWNCFCKRQHQRPWLSVWLCKPFSRAIHSYRWIIYLQTPFHTNNSFCLALKYVWRLVRGHCLFQDEMYCVLCIKSFKYLATRVNEHLIGYSEWWFLMSVLWYKLYEQKIFLLLWGHSATWRV